MPEKLAGGDCGTILSIALIVFYQQTQQRTRKNKQVNISSFQNVFVCLKKTMIVCSEACGIVSMDDFKKSKLNAMGESMPAICSTAGIAEHSSATMYVSVAGSVGRSVVASILFAALGYVSHTCHRKSPTSLSANMHKRFSDWSP